MSDPTNTSDPASDGPDDPSGIRTQLTFVGDQIAVGSSDDDLIGVERAATRRTRRRRVATGMIGAGALIVGGVAVVNLTGEQAPDSVAVVADDGTDDAVDDDANADETNPVATDDTAGSPESDGGDGAPAPVETAVPPAPAAATGAIVSADQTTIEGDLAEGAFANTTLLSWRDGFLALSTEWSAQLFPAEFPEEVTALFSDEVLDLIAEQQPTTIDEATSMLSAAGLLDEVVGVLNDHPEVSEAIYSVPPVDPVVTAEFSTDGVAWDPVEYVAPASGLGEQIPLHSIGDRLVGLVTRYDQAGFDPGAPSVGPPPLERISVVSTVDLVSWTETIVEIPSSAVDFPDFVVDSTFPNELALTETGWAFTLERSVEINPQMLFEAELADSEAWMQYGYGVNLDDAGVVLQIYAEDGSIEEVVRTWDELGVDPITDEELYGGTPPVVMSGTFDGVINEPVELPEWGMLVGGPAGFLRVGESSWFSADGTDWAEVESADARPWFNGVTVRRGDDLVVFPAGDGDAEPLVFDPVELVWRPTDAPALPANSYHAFGGATGWVSGAVLYSVSPPYEPEPFESSASIEVDGYTFSQTATHLGQSYSLAGPDGTEIVSESFVNDRWEEWPDGGPYEHLTFTESGLSVADPETGEVLIEMSHSSLQPMYRELSPPMTDVGPSEMPATRLLATNGVDWIDEEIIAAQPDPTEELESMLWPNGVAINDGVVLVALSDGSYERFEF